MKERIMGTKMTGVQAPRYNSDKDLDEDTQNEIRAVGEDSPEADAIRKKGWGKAGPFTKIGRMMKGVYDGDQHE